MYGVSVSEFYLLIKSLINIERTVDLCECMHDDKRPVSTFIYIVVGHHQQASWLQGVASVTMPLLSIKETMQLPLSTRVVPADDDPPLYKRGSKRSRLFAGREWSS